MPTPHHLKNLAVPGNRYTLKEAAAQGLMLSLYCARCRKPPVLFLASDLIEVLPPTRFVRPGLGTGFLGAFTTFSSLATSTDQLAAHGHAGIAVAYAVLSLFGGLACASFGLVAGRSLRANRHRRSREREDL